MERAVVRGTQGCHRISARPLFPGNLPQDGRANSRVPAAQPHEVQLSPVARRSREKSPSAVRSGGLPVNILMES